jgi:hypothetical protein
LNIAAAVPAAATAATVPTVKYALGPARDGNFIPPSDECPALRLLKQFVDSTDVNFEIALLPPTLVVHSACISNENINVKQLTAILRALISCILPKSFFLSLSRSAQRSAPPAVHFHFV